MIGDALEFFDYFLIGFVLAFIIGPWKLTFGQSAVVLLSSGIGAIIGAMSGAGSPTASDGARCSSAPCSTTRSPPGCSTSRRRTTGSISTILRFFVGFGVGGLYCVDLPLVQEFMPTSKRGWVGGLVTAVIPIGIGLGAVLGAYATPHLGWRGLFASGPAVAAGPAGAHLGAGVAMLAGPPRAIRRSAQVARLGPRGRRRDPADADGGTAPVVKTNWFELFKYPRSLLVSWLGNLGAQTGVYGVTLGARAVRAVPAGLAE